MWLAAFAWLLTHLTSLVVDMAFVDMAFVGMAPAGALAEEQSYPPPPPRASFQPNALPTTQPGIRPVLLAALEQEPSIDTLQPKGRAAELEAKAAGAVVLQTTPAGPAAASMHPPPLHPFQRDWNAVGATQGVLQPAGVLVHSTAKVPP